MIELISNCYLIFLTLLFSVQTFVAQTPKLYSYDFAWYNLPGRTSVVFKIKACGDAYVALSMYTGVTSTDTYEVVIGGFNNKRSEIRMEPGGQHVAEADTAEILSCSESRAFWISWDNNEVLVGKGASVGYEVFLAWREVNPHPVEGVSIATGQDSGQLGGTWEFTDIPGRFNSSTDFYNSSPSYVMTLCASQKWFHKRVGFPSEGQFSDFIMLIAMFNGGNS